MCLRTISIRLKVLSALGSGCGEVIDGSGGGYLLSISITKVRGKVGQSMEHLQKDVAYPLLLSLYMVKVAEKPRTLQFAVYDKRAYNTNKVKASNKGYYLFSCTSMCGVTSYHEAYKNRIRWYVYVESGCP